MRKRIVKTMALGLCLMTICIAGCNKKETSSKKSEKTTQATINNDETGSAKETEKETETAKASTKLDKTPKEVDLSQFIPNRAFGDCSGTLPHFWSSGKPMEDYDYLCIDENEKDKYSYTKIIEGGENEVRILDVPCSFMNQYREYSQETKKDSIVEYELRLSYSSLIEKYDLRSTHGVQKLLDDMDTVFGTPTYVNWRGERKIYYVTYNGMTYLIEGYIDPFDIYCEFVIIQINPDNEIQDKYVTDYIKDIEKNYNSWFILKE